jgi:TonB family protein
MLNYLLNLTACWLIFYGLYYFLLRKNTFFHSNRFFLLIGLLVGVWIPQIDLSIWLQQDNSELLEYFVQPLQYQLPVIEVGENNPLPATTFSWTSVLWGIYLLGVIIASARFFYGVYQLRQLYKGAQLESKHGYTLVLSQKPHLPFSFFSLLFISAAISYSEDDEQQIVEHELAHIKGWHSIDVLMIELLKIIFWFHPLVYFYQAAMRDVHEYIADEKVLQNNRPKAYGQLLIRQLQSRPHIAFANHFVESQLKKRIIMMTRTKSSRSKLWRYALVLPLFAFAMMAFSNKAVSLDNISEPTTLVSGDGEVDEMPRFPGCEDLDGTAREQCAQKKLLEFIYMNIKYPAEARKNGIQGTVVVKFVVGKEGTVKDIEIVKEIGGTCGEAAKKVVEKMNADGIRWVPGVKDGKAVDVEINLPVSFKLANDDTPAKKEENVHQHKNELDKIHVVGHGTPKEIFKVVEEMPRFPGCEDLDGDAKERQLCSQKKLLEFIYQNITYPREAKEANQEGMVVVKFIVNTEGTLENAKIIRDPAPSLSAEVLRLIYMMNQMDEKWIPGKQRGQKVNVEFNLPVRFKLDSGSSEQPLNKDNYLALDEFITAPNPTTGSFNLRFKGPQGAIRIDVTDISGRPVITKEVNNFDGFYDETLDLSGNAAGVYVISVVQGAKRYSQVIMLQQ